MVRNETGRGAVKEQDALARIFHLVRDDDYTASWSSIAFVSFRSVVSNPSVNQP